MKKKDLLIILLLFLFTLPSVFPLLHHGFFLSDDGEWMIIRLSAFYQALHDGQFPVRFLQRLNFGYGYPAAEFLYPGSMYFGSFLHIIRFGFVNSIKIVYGVSLIGSAFFTYFWLSRLFSKFPSFVGALFALYIPYHLYDVYKRGTLEVFALLWVPFILWQMERKSIFWVSIGISLLLISHNTMALLFLPVLYMYGLLRKLYPFWHITVTFILGGLLASFFTIPAVFELHDTVFLQTHVANPLIHFASVQLLGYAVLCVLGGTVISFFIKNKEAMRYRKIAVYFFLVSLVTIFISTPGSSFLWHLPQADLIQFPFRTLSYFTMSSAFLAGFLVAIIKGKQQWVVGIILLVLLGYFAIPYNKTYGYFDKGEGYYYTNDATTTVQDEYMPVWVEQKPFQRPDQKVLVIKGSGMITNISPTNNSLIFTADVTKSSIVQVNTVYWPGWQATLDGKPVFFSYNNPAGVMTLSVPKGEHRIKFSFGESPIRLFADALSILALLSLILFIKRYPRQK